MTHVDTTFLVDLLKESRRAAAGPATRLLDLLVDTELGVSIFVLCELEAGIHLSVDPARERQRVETVVRPLALVPPDRRVAAIYGELFASLQSRGEMLSALDLLIGSTALANSAPLVTRNRRHFERIAGLELISY